MYCLRKKREKSTSRGQRSGCAVRTQMRGSSRHAAARHLTCDAWPRNEWLATLPRWWHELGYTLGQSLVLRWGSATTSLESPTWPQCSDRRMGTVGFDASNGRRKTCTERRTCSPSLCSAQGMCQMNGDQPIRRRRLDPIDFGQLKRQVSVTEVLERLTSWQPTVQRKGGDELRGPCPIHGSKSPRAQTFSVSLSKSSWRCFKCEDGGNVIDLAAVRLDIPRAESVRTVVTLCRRLGIDVPRK